MENVSDLNIGSTVWVFYSNRKIYRNGKMVFAEHFTPATIIGQTHVSWLIGGHYDNVRKVNKKTMKTVAGVGVSPHVYASRHEVDDAIYVHENRADLSEKVLRCNDAIALRRVAEALEDCRGVVDRDQK